MMTRFILASVCWLILFPVCVEAKHPTRYGSEPKFWQSHTLVLGIAKHIEPRDEAIYHITIHVEECIGLPVPVEGGLEVEYTVPQARENRIAGLEIGDRVLALVRPTFGRAKIPTEDGESFAMMPKGAAFYRFTEKLDPTAEETMQIGRVIAMPEFRDRMIAISSIMTKQPNLSDEKRIFMRTYVENQVRQVEADLSNANTLLEQLKVGTTEK